MNGYGLPTGAQGLIAALAVGLVIGLERGWHDRELPEGGRVAGLRTFALTGLFGGVLGHLQSDFGAWPLLGALLGLSLLLTVSYARQAKLSGNLSATRGRLRIRIAKYYKGFPTKVKQNLRRHESHCD